VTSPTDGGTYELIGLPKDATGASDPTDIKRGLGNAAVFVARNRFATFTSSTQLVEIKDLSNSTTKSFNAPPGTTDITYGGTGCLLLLTPTNVVLHDIQQKKQLAELSVAGVKYVSWSNDGLYAALLSKHNVTIVNKNLEQVSTLHETIRIKSATWDDSGVLLYSTLNHIKYTLLNGDNGILRTLDQTVYLVKVKGRNVYCLDRYAKPKVLSVDPTEYRFKLALVKRNYDEMLQIIKNSSLVGQSIIAYVQKKGYPEIALQFVQDPQTRFELAIECGNLEVATEMAKELDRPKIWTRLGAEALIHGNHQTVEMTYQKLRNFDKLSFLYLCTGDEEKLTRMAKIAEHRGDFVSRFQNALYLGDVETRIQMFKEIDLYPLAYLTAKTHGLTEECQSILELCGLTEDQISMPESGHAFAPTKVIAPTYKANWPVKEASHSSFEKALLGEVSGAKEDETNPDLLNEDAPVIADGTGLAVEDEADAVEGWDMGDDIGLDTAGDDSEFVNVDNPDAPVEAAGPGSSEADMWARNSPLAADHVAAGSFESAMQLLNRQIGAVNFAPLKPRFLEIYQASRTFLPANAGLSPMLNYVRRNIDETDSRKLLPVIPRSLDTLSTVDLQGGYTAMRTNKLENGVVTFHHILQSLLVNVVGSEAQVDEAKALIAKCMEYTLAMSIELERRQLATAGGDSDEQLKRQLELSAYFTVPKLDVSHRQLALMAAMKLAFSNKQFSSALSFANRVLANGGAPKLVEQVSVF
jgi:coatomer protein complex subunit alpha (xenin)